MNSQKESIATKSRSGERTAFLLGLLLAVNFLNGQSLPRLDLDFSVNGVSLLFPLAGGLNSPQFSSVDLNNDGLLDLHVFDRVGDKQLTFLNNGRSDGIPYRFAPEFAENFPEITNWMMLRDYNGDGVMDLFAYADQNFDAVMVFTGRYENDRIQFDRFQFNADRNVIYVPRADGGSSQLFVSTIDYPAVDDMDCDGDLDILTFNLVGGFVELYVNESVERGFGRDSLIFRLDNKCWGGFFESGVSNEVDLAEGPGDCVNSLLAGDLEIRHSGSTLLTFDADGDQDKELILGDISFENINFLNNGGDCDQAWMNFQDPNFPSADVPVEVPFFPATFYLDVDNDGLKDLLVAPNVSLNGEDNAVWRYKNMGASTQTDFQLVQTDFLVDEMVDLGSGARPVFVDYNVDGRLDLIVANSSFYEPLGVKNARLFLYENVGSATEPIFQLVDDDYLSLNQFSQSAYAFTPALGDLDSDGDLDAVVGEQGGRLFFVENLAGSGNPFIFGPAQFAYMEINVGQASVPQLIDLNRDGLLDLVVGERNGNINYFQNQGTSTEAGFSSEPTQMIFGGVDTRITGFTTGYSSPYFFEQDGQFLLLTGTETGRIELYNGIENNLDGSFTVITETYGNLREGTRTHPALADIDRDGLLELAVGNFSGGLAIFQTDFKSSTPVPVKDKVLALDDLEVWPNPAQDKVTLSLRSDALSQVILSIYNAQGQLILRQNWAGERKELSVNSWPAGLYWIHANSQEGIRTKSLVIE